MRSRQLTLAVLVVTLWGLNFVFIQVALRTVPPLLLSALRFFLTAVPAILFVRRPRIPFRALALYGLSIFACQFGFLFAGMKAGVPAGLASLLVQVQVFFTFALAMWAFGDRPRATTWIGALVAFGGVGIIALHARGEVSLAGIALIIGAALSWAVGNVAAKRAGPAHPFALVVWGSALSFPPLLAASLLLEGTAPLAAAAHGLSLELVGSLAYIVYVSTHLCYSLWSALMRRHAPSTVAPMTLLVPISGLLSSALLLGEPLPPWKLGAACLVLGGVALNAFGGRLVRLARSRAPARPSTPAPRAPAPAAR